MGAPEIQAVLPVAKENRNYQKKEGKDKTKIKTKHLRESGCSAAG